MSEILEKIYDHYNIKDRVKNQSNILLILPSKDYNYKSFLDKFWLDEIEVDITYPKLTEQSNELIIKEISDYSLAIQIDCDITRKLPWFRNGESSIDLDKKIKAIRGDDFINLHHHDDYSVRDGLGTVGQLIELLKSRNQKFCCITNHGSVGGWITQYLQCKKANIKSLFGCEFYLNNYRGTDIEQRKLHRSNYHLVLIAKNEEGYRNIIRIHNDAQLNGFYYKPRANHENIKKYGKSIVALSGCFAGEVATLVRENKFEEAKQNYEFYKSCFDDFYIELTMIEMDEQIELNRKLVKFAKEINAKMVVTLDSHYIYPENSETHSILLMIKDHKTINDLKDNPEEVWQFKAQDLFYRTEVQLRDLWNRRYKDDIFTEEVLNEAILNTRRIALSCDKIKIESPYKLPKLYENAEEVLKQHARQGLRKCGLIGIPKYEERLEFELDVICKMGFADYFLIVEKIVNDTKEYFGDLATGYGRGSASGSLASYCLKITDIDPIKYKLLFERFLSYDRAGADYPDIDLDFHPAVRDWVKNHIVELFGEKYTCSIGTYQRYKTKVVIIDTARALGLDVWEAMNVTKQLDAAVHVDGEDEKEFIDKLDWEELFIHFPELKSYFDSHPDVFRHCSVIRNQVKNMGKHAGGMIISNLDLQDHIPVFRDKEDQIVSAWAEGQAVHELSVVGLVKFDILGLKNLSIIQDCLKYIEENRGIKLTKDNLDIDNKEAIKVSSRSDLVGIFQFENPATKPVSDAVKMDSLNDISAVTSLIRPGPRNMGMDKEYAERKMGRKNWEIPVCLREILNDTYGIIVYQEQYMLLAQKLCGFTAVDSNKLRKTLNKEKNPEVILSLKKKFLEGAKPKIDNGEVTEEEVRNWIDLVFSFARYGFCKCVTPDTVVETRDGFKTLEEIEIGEEILTPEGFNKVVNTYDTGIKEVYEITTENGYKINATLEHKFLCKDGEIRQLIDIIAESHDIMID